MRILLVTDDGRYADDGCDGRFATRRRLHTRGGRRRPRGDHDVAPPNVVVLDADNKIARTSRTATVFAALHPRIATVIVAERAPERIVGNLQVVDKRRSAERLLGDLEHALLGLCVSRRGGRLAGPLARRESVQSHERREGPVGLRRTRTVRTRNSCFGRCPQWLQPGNRNTAASLISLEKGLLLGPERSGL